MKLSEGLEDQGIVVGNAYDKYGSRNPIVKWIMSGFHSAIDDLVDRASPESIHEVGCGEGFWVCKWQDVGIEVRGSDFSAQVIALARENARESGGNESAFSVRNIYDLDRNVDQADLIVCCEVLEHLEDPDRALKVLASLVHDFLLISVPREPIWCALNVLRGKYLRRLGNTPGHVQHWSKNSFVSQVEQYFDIVEVRTPLPWTVILCRKMC